MTPTEGTYVYCVIAAARRPRLSRIPHGPSGLGPVRLLEVEQGLYIAAADAPLDKYGEAALGQVVSDLDQISRAALAHEAVVESFASAPAVLPMKLFTLFASDARAVGHVRGRRRRIASIVERVAHRQEWGVRVLRGSTRVAAPVEARCARSGLNYLSCKKATRDAPHQAIAGLYERLAAHATRARHRNRGGRPALLDAAFLVPRARAASFQAQVSRESRNYARHGYRLTLSGPWPPYSFMQD
ncbi:MAG TPA: GvpL/GvpF family gas vesicle protein [Burkholderiales bacterium]|nr:GvpL/GvpF family gas vesicle protein [Burkholderiales bacterium]